MDGDFAAYDLSVEALHDNNIFIAAERPEFSWKVRSSRPGARQSAYRIVAREAGGATLWDSGWVTSPQSAWIAWQGLPLAVGMRVVWQVSLRDETGKESPPATAEFGVALRNNGDWHNARWMWFDGNNYSTTAPSPCFRREFELHKPVRRATLSITARGVLEAYLNGRRISDDEFTPGWTDFTKRIQFVTYDVSELVQNGGNALGVVIADGWCCGNLTTIRRRNVFHPHPEALVLLDVEFFDGTHQLVESNADWRVTTGAILASDIYDGETYDARLEMPGWNQFGFDDSAWKFAAVSEFARDTQARLEQKVSPPVRVVEELRPIAILNPKKDVYIWDFGQNITGKMRVKVRGWAGRLYTFTFAEMLDETGMLYNLNYRCARVTDCFICGENMLQNGGFGVYEPHFTFHGFRYMRIDGFQFADTKLEDVEAVALVMHTDLPRHSAFACGNENVNQLFRNIVWGQRGNFLEIPTDCPQRDERLGWTGDANLFCGTALVNMDADAFFRKWLADVCDTQHQDGAITCFAPDCLPGMPVGQAAWADAVVQVPWRVYRDTGDRKILADNFEAMEKWMAWQCANAQNFIRQGRQLADWLTPDAVKCPDEFVATVYFALTAQIMVRVTELLGKRERAAYYRELHAQIVAAIEREFVAETGLPKVCNQTACLLMLTAGIGSPALLAERLKQLIRANGNRLATGFIGTALLNLVLAENGLDEVATDLLLQTECPSWLFPVLQGATTMWERWDSYTKEKGFGDVTMNSFNHYAYGAVGEWMMSRLAGLECDFERGGLIYDARFDRRLGECQARRGTVFGTMTSHWIFDEKKLFWSFLVPANASAQVVIRRPGATLDDAPTGEGTYPVAPGTHTVVWSAELG